MSVCWDRVRVVSQTYPSKVKHPYGHSSNAWSQTFREKSARKRQNIMGTCFAWTLSECVEFIRCNAHTGVGVNSTFFRNLGKTKHENTMAQHMQHMVKHRLLAEAERIPARALCNSARPPREVVRPPREVAQPPSIIASTASSSNSTSRISSRPEVTAQAVSAIVYIPFCF